MKSKDGRSHISVDQNHWNNIFKKQERQMDGYDDHMADKLLDAKMEMADWYCRECDEHKEDGICPICEGDEDE